MGNFPYYRILQAVFKLLLAVPYEIYQKSGLIAFILLRKMRPVVSWLKRTLQSALKYLLAGLRLKMPLESDLKRNLEPSVWSSTYLT